MELIRQSCLFRLIMVVMLAVRMETVTVSPCPTNKIAPHRRIANWGDDEAQPRTIGAFYDLFAPNKQQYASPPPGSLLEEPQKDELDDCGEIEDYDENDLSSLISPQRRQSEYSRLYFSGLHRPQRPSQQGQHEQGQYGQQQGQYGSQQGQYGQQQGQYGQQQGQYGQQQGQYGQQQGQYGQQQGQHNQRPPFRPQKPSYPPTRPPYSSGGIFGNNPYRPPLHQDPSDHVKPVHEGGQFHEPQMTYRPDLVGGPIGHVVGVSPARPTRRPPPEPTPQRQPGYVKYPARPTRAPEYENTTRRPRPRNINYNNSVIGSFFDLLFK